MARPGTPGDIPDRTFAWSMVALAVVGLIVRVIFLGIFPDVQNDEGLWTNPAKNRVLFGDWFFDGRNHLFLSPLYNLAAWVSFTVLGPSIEAGRLVSALAGAATVPLMGYLAASVSGNRMVGLLSAIVLVLDPWTVLTSRQAMIESLLLFFLVLGGWLVLRGGRSTAGAGASLGCAVLCKLTALPMVAPLGLYLLLAEGSTGAERLKRLVHFGLGLVLVVVVGYGLAYLVEPTRFIAAFARELGGEHVRPEDGSGRGLLGRLAVSPVIAGQSVLEIVRMNPLLFGLGVTGILVLIADGGRRWVLPTAWLVFALGFPLTQVYQPIRYFFAIVPPLVVGVGLLFHRLASTAPSSGRRALLVALLLVLTGFNAAYLSANFLANRSDRVQTVARWVHETLPEDVTISASPHFATDLQNPVIPPDLLGDTWTEIQAEAKRRGIGVFIWDEDEWSSEARHTLESEWMLLVDFGFARIFARNPP